MNSKKRLFFALALIAATSCSSSHAGIERVMILLNDGNRMIGARSAANAFGMPLDCSTKSFDKILVHDDTLGCMSCVSFDVTPTDDCRFEVRTVYLSLSGNTQQQALAKIRHYIERATPGGFRRLTEDQASPSAESSEQQVVEQVGLKTYEAHVQVSRVGSGWVASAVMFQFDTAGQK